MSSSDDILRCLNAKNASIHKVFLLNLIIFTPSLSLLVSIQKIHNRPQGGVGSVQQSSGITQEVSEEKSEQTDV